MAVSLEMLIDRCGCSLKNYRWIAGGAAARRSLTAWSSAVRFPRKLNTGDRMNGKVKVAIIGPGNIGTDLMIKVRNQCCADANKYQQQAQCKPQ